MTQANPPNMRCKPPNYVKSNQSMAHAKSRLIKQVSTSFHHTVRLANWKHWKSRISGYHFNSPSSLDLIILYQLSKLKLIKQKTFYLWMSCLNILNLHIHKSYFITKNGRERERSKTMKDLVKSRFWFHLQQIRLST